MRRKGRSIAAQSLVSAFVASVLGRGVLASFVETAFGPLGDSLLVQQDGLKLPKQDYVDDLINKAVLYAGLVTFAHLDVSDSCFTHNSTEPIDVAVVGAPFDTGVTYRAGARFGPAGIREGSRRKSLFDMTERTGDLAIVDCADVAMTPFDNRVALDQLYRAHRAIHSHPTTRENGAPKILTLGGDHTVTFSALRSASQVHGPLVVVHFDSHIDTWDPVALGGNISSYAQLNHGTFLHFAHEKGYLAEHGNLHVGIRAPMVRRHKDPEHDRECGFEIVTARDLDRIGVDGVVDSIKAHTAGRKTYISVDIDVLDPVYAPGTGTPEPGGLTTRELLAILEGLDGIELVGADVVEVAPAYDSQGGVTALAAAEVAVRLIDLM